ncbi:AfsR/SARP family transcriptional regulator [Actinoplanes hulinensis]|uniref:AfsR/SARP family transcriptional regulator n=1 Tax=Actinoplanes hulinensis TaxID=1144547 RepID=A0ABS7B089_9ACTN|nr:AfsR/SARP family transcriptional regulator [Actinoplanes hulinensis]
MGGVSGNGDRLRVGLLGELRVCRGDVDVTVPGARLRGLLVRLAVAGGRPVPAGALAGAVWPEEQPGDPANALQSLISRLRRLLGGGDTVTQAEGGYRLAVEAEDVDAGRFERLVADGREWLRGDQPRAAAGLLREAVALVRGPIAAELGEVAPAQAVRLGRVIVEAGADLAEAEVALGELDRAADRLTGLLAEHPLNERLAGLLIDALAGQGRQGEALAVYERIRERLADQLGADPGAALRERHLRLLRGAPVVPPRSVVPEAGPPRRVSEGNLPAPLTSFIGREDDLARIDALLTRGRLVTVLGPGGAGKTRLALEAARRYGDHYRDGTWLVDLASVTEPAKVGAAVVAAAGLRGSALFETANRARPDGRDDLDVLAERLSGREILLLVDNCEHLVDAVAHLLSRLLVCCPRLRVLATSREPLAVDGESLVPLGPLGLPEPGARAVQAAGAPAVRLFAERAGAVRPGFTVGDGTVGDIVRIVRGLDGLPLALELAAARLRTLGLAELSDGLSDRFRLLTTGSRTAQPRHRTLRAVIAWSWDLLDDAERAMAEHVAVLPGGVTVASAAAVSGSGAVTADLLACLVDRSLLQLAPGGRYRMLETIREYGLERLAEQGVLGEVRARAAAHLAALVAHHDPLLRTAEQMAAIRVLRAEYDNALAALRHLCDTGDAPAALALALDLCWYWHMMGRHADAAYWLAEALAVPGDTDPVLADCAEAVMAINRGGTEPSPVGETAARRQKRLRTVAQRLGTHPELPGPAGVIATMALYFAGEKELADRRIEQLITGPDRWKAALAHMYRAQVAENDGDTRGLAVNAGAALDAFREIGDRWGQASVLPLRALIRQFDGDLDGALTDLRAARAFAAEFGSLDVNDEIFIDLRWADLHMRRGDPAEATAALATARQRAERSGNREIGLLVDALEAGMLIWQGELDRGEELINRAADGLGVDAEEMPMMGGDHGTAIVGAVRASVALRRGDPGTAEKALLVAYPAALETHDMPILALVAVAAAGLAGLHGRHRDAAVLLGASARLRGAHDHTDLNVAKVATEARAALGDDGFGEAYAVGWTLDAEAARSLVDPARRSPGPALPSGPA